MADLLSLSVVYKSNIRNIVGVTASGRQQVEL